ncbi:hypothetical protein [Pseudonocardia hydrocarbonoxydans]|uniref:Uncharacterized protein n=1 Tax=Pseudonocardia hydrocarbonoxydans TaxID=76726 RepID=A0A4Y3WN10_9PSEU|nr:hypothetical protein [Pseudonocardia hydrocarbonoxydans]GEC20273.1 hypothetical protein PHY01_25560 [Pseudonocardia hydrocarbonoxydans]
MFFDIPDLPLVADLRHRELVAEAERFRLGRLARAARRARRAERPPAPPGAAPTPAANTDPNRRYAVSR